MLVVLGQSRQTIQLLVVRRHSEVLRWLRPFSSAMDPGTMPSARQRRHLSDWHGGHVRHQSVSHVLAIATHGFSGETQAIVRATLTSQCHSLHLSHDRCHAPHLRSDSLARCARWLVHVRVPSSDLSARHVAARASSSDLHRSIQALLGLELIAASGDCTSA